jgi:uncharacterized damage-inducible protein DinB
MLPVVADAAARWREVTGEIMSVATTMSPERWDLPSACGTWTNKELLAHLATGYVVRIDRLDGVLAGRAPSEVSDIDAVNERNVASWALAPVEAVIAEMLATRNRVLDLIERLEPSHLAVELPGAPSPARFGETLAALSDHDTEHAAQLRAALT